MMTKFVVNGQLASPEDFEAELKALYEQAQKDMKACPECLGEKVIPEQDPLWPDQWTERPCPECT